MQIKIGFVHSTRELVISTDADSAKPQSEYVAEIEAFLKEGSENATLTLEGAKGARYILVRSQVAYVEVGAEAKNSVGFLR